MNSTIESEQSAAPAEVSKPKAKRAAAKKAKPAKKAKKAVGKTPAERNNKKARVIAMMKRAKGATLAEIMAATKWQAHTVRGFVSILGTAKAGRTLNLPEQTEQREPHLFLGHVPRLLKGLHRLAVNECALTRKSISGREFRVIHQIHRKNSRQGC